MEPQTYRTRAKTVKAVKIDKDNLFDVGEWAGFPFRSRRTVNAMTGEWTAYQWLELLDKREAHPGDWLVKDEYSEWVVIDDEQFSERYEPESLAVTLAVVTAKQDPEKYAEVLAYQPSSVISKATAASLAAEKIWVIAEPLDGGTVRISCDLNADGNPGTPIGPTTESGALGA